MSFLSDLNAPDLLEGVSFSGFLGSILIVIFVFIIIVTVGIFGYWIYYKKFKKLKFKNQILIFVVSNGKLQLNSVDYAMELFVPDTNISLYFLQNKRIYLARPTRSMGKNKYWFCIAENGEWINFDLSMHPEDNTIAIANYDHRDTRYAFVNLTEIIKRNYKDKQVNWWKEYSNVITIIIVAIMFIAMMWFFFWRSGILIEQMKPIGDALSSASDKIVEATKNLQNVNSGIANIE